ncbi:hypothetical protein NM208_g3068 [Fusarium decemcellulare]|uniref:Uncharacterized protein n=1 Tax=Fusarium decemcellulare TaxID=57161 RepID=A0ACC1SQF6_9HYPO|nr:hypothetical protein NM208_g3068 [Fusarium decemcellulare]
MPLIAVFGATGAQGGSVVDQLSKDPRWVIRGITRDANSDKARLLESKGAQVVNADMNDESSLVKALQGAEAIFAVTAITWESITQLGVEGTGEQELNQLINVARVAAKSPHLKHFIISTLPRSHDISNGSHRLPHFNYKQMAVDWIKVNTPGLWAKTTEFWAGWYVSNLHTMPLMQFRKLPMSEAHVLMLPASPSVVLPIAGDLQTNCGIIIDGILTAGPKAFGKIAICITDYRPLRDVVACFEQVSGKPAVFVEVSESSWRKLWGLSGLGFAAQLQFSKSHPNWHDFEPDRIITVDDLGVRERLVDFRQAMVASKGKIS